MERFIAIDDVCAWPNLTQMADGSIVATIFNQPCHGRWEGDVECWNSADGGQCWQRIGIPADHEPGTNRMNVAAGLAHDGDLIVIASGWSHKAPRGEEPPAGTSTVLAPWVCRSSDGGRSWERTEEVALPEGIPPLIPFGDIVCSPDGSLGVSFYSWHEKGSNTAYLLRSRDDGRSWGEAVVIGADDYNETDLLCIDEKRWLAAARTLRDGHLDLFCSDDSGSTWARRGTLTLPGQHPAHLLQLADGSILLVYGIRNRGLYGVGARLSGDGGESWGAPILLVDTEDATDGGYPSSVQLADGSLVTAYYCNQVPAHRRYHMGVVRWESI
ncbi:MAG: exo-alpha-sialidase [Gemmatimonadetes bacterium]|jgi:hypothetical protein|nr:exo-alpha-sialidase [Gemmatimonadota bacterium]